MCSKIGERLDQNFALRCEAAANFTGGLSETGCRFLAEVIAQHYFRKD